jgi:hypothetical protein
MVTAESLIGRMNLATMEAMMHAWNFWKTGFLLLLEAVFFDT